MKISMYIENIVIGNPIIEEYNLFGLNEDDFNLIEKEKTYYTEERFLPKILVSIGVSKSISEIRRNRKDLCVNLDKLDFIEINFKKQKRKLYILVGK